ncbi:hypothetical protein WOLCODRAFT_117137 [Wolfiporia cocos MD-104 SS10]|uniref:Xylanolytic transcriptional activator regulatory domain-containing protein n=1 Tax=Wolfiporia cocos (strain MD-104) TaxID=742152 RepID=A0A2H3JDP7_WOLCO|nr:hypothetical protein WOLCODRAFT_117137 [Wolfiporia cocos MD-104 SS10]
MSTSSRGSAESAITASKQALRNILTPLSALPEPSAATVQILINTFFQHADQVGFFLHRGWFMRLLSARSIHPQQQAISPALLNALYLWGVRLATLDTLLLYEPVFLSRATQALAGTVAHMPSYSITHTIQAEILLANFHFASGQLAQARHHCSAATALALSCRLHQVRSIQLPRTNPIHAMEFNPPPPADVTEEAERIQAFWQVFILDACLAVPSRLPSRFVGSHGAQVDTPWPLDAEAYEQGGFPSGIRGSSTVEAFLRGTDLNPYHGSSSVALHAKAAALFERAADMASRFLTATDTEQFAAEFVALDSIIDHFSNSLMPVNMSAGLDATRRLLVTHTLARVATIQLHQRLREMEALTESKDVSAAKAAASLLDGVSMGQVGYISPILGLLWSIVARVLHSEMTRLRSLWMSASTFGHQSSNAQQLRYMQEEHDKVAAALAKVCNAMSSLASTSSYMAMQAEICRREMMQAGTGQ